MKAALARSALRTASGSTRPPALQVTPRVALKGVEVSRFSGAQATFSTSASLHKKKSKKGKDVDDAVIDDDAAFSADDDLFAGATSTESSSSFSKPAEASSGAASSSKRAASPKKASAQSAEADETKDTSFWWWLPKHKAARMAKSGTKGQVPNLRSSGPVLRQPRSGFFSPRLLTTFEEHLSWENVDKSREPSLSKWRALAQNANSKEDLLRTLELAQLYRDRVGSLGVESGARFGTRAAAIGLPEIGLNALLDRYKSGMEADLETLYQLQKALRWKAVYGDKKTLMESLELEGAPAQTNDLLAPPAAAEGEDATPAEPAWSPEEIELHRARLSLMDRMSLLVLLTPPLNNGQTDPVLLAFVPATYIRVFKLTDASMVAKPQLAQITAKTDELIDILAEAADVAVRHKLPVPTHHLAKPTESSAKGAVQRGVSPALFRKPDVVIANFKEIMSYLATKPRGTRTASGRDPIQVLYAYMHKFGDKASLQLMQKVEPILRAGGVRA